MKTWTKIAWGVLGTILLGAISSGLWEFALRPAFLNLSNALINFLITISDSFSQYIYYQVAKGLHEASSVSILMVIHAFLATIMAILLFITINQLRTNAPATNSRVSKPLFFESKLFRYLILLYSIFTLCTVLFASFEEMYVNDKIAYFNQLGNTVAPYLSPQDNLLLKSEFAQIRTRQDYETLTTKMIAIAVENGLKYENYSLFY